MLNATAVFSHFQHPAHGPTHTPTRENPRNAGDLFRCARTCTTKLMSSASLCTILKFPLSDLRSHHKVTACLAFFPKCTIANFSLLLLHVDANWTSGHCDRQCNMNNG